MSDSERIVELLRSEDPKPVKGLQEAANYKSEKDITIYIRSRTRVYGPVRPAILRP